MGKCSDFQTLSGLSAGEVKVWDYLSGKLPLDVSHRHTVLTADMTVGMFSGRTLALMESSVSISNNFRASELVLGRKHAPPASVKLSFSPRIRTKQTIAAMLLMQNSHSTSSTKINSPIQA